MKNTKSKIQIANRIRERIVELVKNAVNVMKKPTKLKSLIF